MAKNTTKTKKETNKPTFEEWYNGLSKPAKSAFRVGVRYALKCVKDNQQIEKVLAM